MADQILVLRHLVDEVQEWQKSLYIVHFIDFKKAFNSVFREALWKFSKSYYGIPEKTVHLIRCLYDGSAQGKLFEFFLG